MLTNEPPSTICIVGVGCSQKLGDSVALVRIPVYVSPSSDDVVPRETPEDEGSGRPDVGVLDCASVPSAASDAVVAWLLIEMFAVDNSAGRLVLLPFVH